MLFYDTSISTNASKKVESDVIHNAILASSVLVSALLYFVLLILTQRRAQRALLQLADRSDFPIVLYLRAFKDAQSPFISRFFDAMDPRRLKHITFTPVRHRPFDPEEELASAFARKAILVAIGEKTRSFGAVKLVVEDSRWKQEFQRLADSARFIIYAPSLSENLLWEFRQLFADPKLLRKTVFYMPRNGYAQSWSATQAHFENMFSALLPSFRRRGCFFRIDPNGQLVGAVELESFAEAFTTNNSWIVDSDGFESTWQLLRSDRAEFAIE